MYQLYELASRARINRNTVWPCVLVAIAVVVVVTERATIATSPSPLSRRDSDGLDGSCDKTTSPGPFRDRLTNMMDRPLRYIPLLGHPLAESEPLPSRIRISIEKPRNFHFLPSFLPLFFTRVNSVIN